MLAGAHREDNRRRAGNRIAAGIITEAPGLNSHAAIVGMALEKPVLVDAVNATRILKSGTTVTLDGERGAVMFGNGRCPVK